MCISICGCAIQRGNVKDCITYKKWQYLAKKMYNSIDDDIRCKKRSIFLANRMRATGLKVTRVYGLYKGYPHTWVEWKGRILDPSVVDTRREHYRGDVLVEDK